MKVFMVLGSRNPQGQTAKAAETFSSGITGEGGFVEKALLPLMKIERCRQCEDSGYGDCKKVGRCIIGDDFSSLVDKVLQSDAAVFVNPVYFGDLSESLRAFLDRLRRVTRHPPTQHRIKGKPAIGICVAGGSGNNAPASTVSLEKVLTHCGFEVLDLIPARRQNLEMKLSVLKITGQWLARNYPSGLTK